MAQEKKLNERKEDHPDPEMLKALDMLENMEVLKMMARLKMMKTAGSRAEKRSKK